MDALKGYSSGYSVVTPADYLHGFKDHNDFCKDPSPEPTLYLPEYTVGTVDGMKFNVKDNDLSGAKVAGKAHMTHELAFKAHAPAYAEKWCGIISSVAGETMARKPPV